jgi:hypothetical protein
MSNPPSLNISTDMEHFHHSLYARERCAAIAASAIAASAVAG